MPYVPTPRQYNRWMSRLAHLQQRKRSVPDGTLDWTAEYFGKSPEVQRMFGLNNALKPEAETAAKVLDLIDRAGIVRRTKRGKR